MATGQHPEAQITDAKADRAVQILHYISIKHSKINKQLITQVSQPSTGYGHPQLPTVYLRKWK